MPLRPELYQRLCRSFAHAGGVTLVNEGCEMEYTLTKDAQTGRRRLEAFWSGEYYVTSCPYCGDTRKRLWINHLWGYLHPETRSRNLWLCNCFNEDCLRPYERQLDLYRRVFEDCGPRRPDPLLRTAVARPAPRPEMPGQTFPLHTLPPDHPAKAYLRGLGYDADVLGRILGVGYCPAPHAWCYQTRGRIIIPVVFEGRLAGWQARSVGEPDRAAPKYLSMPGMKKSRLLYNYDAARRQPFVVVCEGVSDVWSFGPEAVALFGKGASVWQVRQLASTWSGGAVVILLDGDATAEAMKLHDALTGVRRKVMVRLPVNLDPGDFASEELRRLVFAQARQQGIELPATAGGR